MLQGVSARELGWRWLRQGGPFCCVCDLSRAAVRRSMFTADPDTLGLVLGGKCRDIPPPTSSVCGRCQLQVEFAAKPQIPQGDADGRRQGLETFQAPGSGQVLNHVVVEDQLASDVHDTMQQPGAHEFTRVSDHSVPHSSVTGEALLKNRSHPGFERQRPWEECIAQVRSQHKICTAGNVMCGLLQRPCT